MVRSEEELAELERLRDEIAKRIMDGGIDEGAGLDIIINDEEE